MEKRFGMIEPFQHIQPENLQFEDQLVWLKPIKEILGVEDHLIVTNNRTRKPKYKTAIVGFGTLLDWTPNTGEAGKFFRRVFVEVEGGLPAAEVLPGVRIAKCK
jgi:hypothetical protein